MTCFKQVDFSYVSNPSQQMTYTSLQSGTLYNASLPSYHHSDTQNITFPLAGHTSWGNFTSGSHFHNVLLLQRDHGELTKLNIDVAHQANPDVNDAHEPNIQNDASYSVEYENDVTTGDQDANDSYAEPHSNNILINMQEKIAQASDNSCITREDNAYIALEEIL